MLLHTMRDSGGELITHHTLHFFFFFFFFSLLRMHMRRHPIHPPDATKRTRVHRWLIFNHIVVKKRIAATMSIPEIFKYTLILP